MPDLKLNDEVEFDYNGSQNISLTPGHNRVKGKVIGFTPQVQWESFDGRIGGTVPVDESGYVSNLVVTNPVGD